jgi:hypothetical protein
MGQVLSVHLEPLTNQHLEPNHVIPILSCFLFTLSAYPIFPKKVLSVSRCHYIYTYTYNDHRRNCGEIILGLAILNMSLRFLQVLLFLMAPAAFRSRICMHALNMIKPTMSGFPVIVLFGQNRW